MKPSGVSQQECELLHILPFLHQTSGTISTEDARTSSLVTIDDECDVEAALQRGGAVLQHQRVQPGILLTNVLNLQSVVQVHPHPLHLELGSLVYRLSIFIPGYSTRRITQPVYEKIAWSRGSWLLLLSVTLRCMELIILIYLPLMTFLLPLCVGCGEGGHVGL